MHSEEDQTHSPACSCHSGDLDWRLFSLLPIPRESRRAESRHQQGQLSRWHLCPPRWQEPPLWSPCFCSRPSKSVVPEPPWGSSETENPTKSLSHLFKSSQDLPLHSTVLPEPTTPYGIWFQPLSTTSPPRALTMDHSAAAPRPPFHPSSV